MVRIRPPNRPASAAALINQEWEGHGLNAQPPVDRGYRLDSQRPPSSVPGPRGDAGDDAKGKGKKKEEKSSLIINVHVREKIIPVNAGAGNQRVYWLGATAVTRYLSQPAAYTTNFSHEMTPKAVLAEDGAQLERTARVCDELADGAHVWIDVGDGALLSHVASRPFPDRQIFEPAGDDEFSEQIVWNESQPDMLDDEIIGIDPRLTMSYARTTIAKQPTFQEWQKVQPASSSSQEGLFEEFSLLWQQVVLDDMPGSTSWMNEVRLGLFHHFESIKYIFSAHSAVAADGSAFMSLLEFWGFCKRCALTSPYANLAKIDKMFATKQTGSNLHDPTRALSLPEFMAALTRISYLRQKNAAKPDVQLPKSLFQLIEDKILPLSPGFDSFDAARAPSSPFTSAAVRQKLTIHETRLKQLFRKWAKQDETRQTIHLDEWLAMFRASGIIGYDLDEAKLREAFVIAILGDHENALASWDEAGEAACCELIFPEFVEAILRAAMLKLKDDKRTTIDLKIHEICLLLIFGPAGVKMKKKQEAFVAPLSGVERRAVLASAAKM